MSKPTDPHGLARWLVRDYIDGQPEKHGERMELPESRLALAIGEALDEKQAEIERLREQLNYVANQVIPAIVPQEGDDLVTLPLAQLERYAAHIYDIHKSCRAWYQSKLLPLLNT